LVGVFFKYQNGSGTVEAGGRRRTKLRKRLPNSITIANIANPTVTTANHNKIAETNSTFRSGGSCGRLAAGVLTSAPFVGDGSAADA
jgi:hypothetical protein